MFEFVLQNVVGASGGLQERAEGVAFLKLARTLHPLSSITYLCFNIPVGPQPKGYVQCTYSDKWAKQCVSRVPIPVDRLGTLAAGLREPLDWSTLPIDIGSQGALEYVEDPQNARRLLSFPLRALAGEMALLCLEAALPPEEWEAQRPVLMREFQVLGGYFHNHIMRIHGHDAEKAILVSARELDCLKWMAAGKTAWEASVILGISERTVRFHLNAAREKLDCLTTTQAVAKAVSQQLI